MRADPMQYWSVSFPQIEQFRGTNLSFQKKLICQVGFKGNKQIILLRKLMDYTKSGLTTLFCASLSLLPLPTPLFAGAGGQHGTEATELCQVLF